MQKLENPQQLFPMFITNKLKETKEFYQQAGFQVRFDMPEYLQVAYNGSLELCFMAPPPGSNKQTFGGDGVYVSIPTPSADDKAAEFRKRRVPLVSEVEDKPWGWRSFHVSDPNGVILDFFHVYKEGPAPNEPS